MVLRPRNDGRRRRMKIFKHSQPPMDSLEQRLDDILDMTRDLDRKEFNCLMDAIKSVFEARQKLKFVKTNEEKELECVNEIEKGFME